MNYICLPQFGITVREKSARAAMIIFLNELIARMPFICDRIFSYMEQEYLPNNKGATRHIVAKTKERLNLSESCQPHIAQLSNGWFFGAHAAPQAYLNGYLVRIEEALGGIPIIALFETNTTSTTHSWDKPSPINGHTYHNLTPEQVELLTRDNKGV